MKKSPDGVSHFNVLTGFEGFELTSSCGGSVCLVTSHDEPEPYLEGQGT